MKSDKEFLEECFEKYQKVFSLQKSMIEPFLEFKVRDGCNIFMQTCSIRMGTGRQTGKTHWAAAKVKESPDTTIVISANIHLRDHMIQYLKNSFNVEGKKNVYTYRDLMALLRTKPKKTVAMINKLELLIVDDASYNGADLYDILKHRKGFPIPMALLG